jgi:hypothetical protein
MGKSASKNRASHWLRVLRPLFGWLLFVLGLFGIREHQRLMEQTRLNFIITLSGQSLETTALLDRKPFVSGERILLGEHTFTFSQPKAEPFTTNFFAWYGRHDLGRINLKRSVGTVSIQANPPAATITITGPEFSTTLSNSIGTNLIVPTDQYEVRAEYSHWSQSQNVTVFDNQSALCIFAPKLGALHLTANKDEVTYSLQSASGQPMSDGNLPAIITDLLADNYQLIATYHQRKLKKSVIIEAGLTNEVSLEFILGAARIESAPSGAEVLTTNGFHLGNTPLELPDIVPHTMRLNLYLAGYETVPISLNIIADQTNVCHTNLTNIRYLSAMRQAREALASNKANDAVEAINEALSAKPDDIEATALLAVAEAHLTADKQAAAAEQQRHEQLKRPREVFDALCQQNPDASLFAEYEMKTASPAKSVAVALAKVLSSEPRPFEILHNDSPKLDAYDITAQQTFSLGILGGTERIVLVVIGQVKSDETQILFKVLEYQIKNLVAGDGLFNLKENRQLIPVSPNRLQMNDMLQTQIKEGVQMVTARVRTAVGQMQ